MRIAIPCWQGRVSPVFDESTALLLLEVEPGREVGRERRSLSSREPQARVREISGLGVEVLICGAISETIESAAAAHGITVFSFICGDIDAVADGYVHGDLTHSRFLMPGCRAKEPESRKKKPRRQKQPTPGAERRQ